ncbi:maleylpyruvate isomerase family mycothiol-dependent enzyme [Solihabitans fulvus]|uniref:maleylpyruvate isomerase family mycothiol-dependent enzyme n=1 Tax=Solihabitans fulvus TaxID=1892852 RepID=UPI001661D6F8|nr:maleylpyruvate isomerase family mycothiol-dependent enzyme [Solihabitans fulvus]
MDTWQLIATERTRLADSLAGLDESAWRSPSLCAGWSNQDALAHIVATAEITQGGFFGGLLRNGFSFQKMVAGDIHRVGAAGVPRMLERLRASAGSRNHPPGPVASMLLEIVVHGEDIAFPLGNAVDHSPEALVGAAEFGKSAQPLVGCRKRIAGLRLRATDAEWSTGSGPEVSGPLVPLLLAMCGRKAALDSLTGEGVAALRERP